MAPGVNLLGGLKASFTLLEWRPQAIRREARTWGERFLARAGAFIRREARKLTRRRKRVSRPGESPSGHTMVLHDFIVFRVEYPQVVVGPLRANIQFCRPVAREFDTFEQAVESALGWTTGMVPGVLEHGGDVGVLETRHFRPGGRAYTPIVSDDSRYEWRRADLRSRRRNRGRRARVRVVHVEPRPYMGPALERGVADLMRKALALPPMFAAGAAG